MRRFALSVTAVLVALAGTVAVAQRVTTEQELDTVMKRVGPAQQGVNKSIQSMAYGDARKNLAIVRQALVDSENFWVVKRRNDAVKFTKDTLAKIDVLEKALAAPSPDNAMVMASFKEVGAACRSCHMEYRIQEGDNFHLKPGSVD